MDDEKLRDLIYRHAIANAHNGNLYARDIVKLLNSGDADLVGQLASRYASIAAKGFDRGPATTKRLEDMLAAIRAVNSNVYSKIADQARVNLTATAANERDFAAAAARKAGVDFEAKLPDANFLQVLVSTSPIPVDQHGGSMLDPWIRGMEDGRMRRLEGAIRTGLLQGETTDALTRRIMGGLLDVSRRSAQTFALTANSTIANRAREETFRAMKSINYVEWSSILDSRTSQICQSLSGKVFELEGPHPTPPAHPRCRSLLIPRKNNTDAPKHKPFGDWLKGQPPDVQNEVLGKARADIFRENPKLDFAEFFRKDAGTYKTIDELKAFDKRILDDKPVAAPAPAPVPRIFSPINPNTRADTIEVKSKRDITKQLNTRLTEAAKDSRYDPVPEFKGIKPEMFGKASLPAAMSDEAASMIGAIMPEVDKITDAFDVPRLRGIRPTGSAIGNMGDGTLGLNPSYFNGYASTVGEGGATSKLTGKIESFQRDMDALREKLAKLKVDFEEAKAANDQARYLAIYAEQRPIAEEYRKLSEKAFKAKSDLNKSNRSATETVSTWKPGDDVKTRPYNATDYFTGIDKARNVIFHEVGHQVHQMLNKTGRRRIAGRPPLEQRINLMFNKKFARLGEGYEAKKLLSTTYATTNAEEWFAENFSLTMMGRRDLVDQDILNLIEELLDAKRG